MLVSTHFRNDILEPWVGLQQLVEPVRRHLPLVLYAVVNVCVCCVMVRQLLASSSSGPVMSAWNPPWTWIPASGTSLTSRHSSLNVTRSHSAASLPADDTLEDDRNQATLIVTHPLAITPWLQHLHHTAELARQIPNTIQQSLTHGR